MHRQARHDRCGQAVLGDKGVGDLQGHIALAHLNPICLAIADVHCRHQQQRREEAAGVLLKLLLVLLLLDVSCVLGCCIEGVHSRCCRALLLLSCVMVVVLIVVIVVGGCLVVCSNRSSTVLTTGAMQPLCWGSTAGTPCQRLQGCQG